MVADNIKNYLKEKGIKISFIAEQIDVPYATVNLMLNGKRRLTADVFSKICKVLEVPMDRFATEKTA